MAGSVAGPLERGSGVRCGRWSRWGSFCNSRPPGRNYELFWKAWAIDAVPDVCRFGW